MKAKELEFCEKWCGKLSDDQIILLKYNIGMGRFCGIGRGIGIGMPDFFPCVLIKNEINIIDKAGYYQFASKEGYMPYVS